MTSSNFAARLAQAALARPVTTLMLVLSFLLLGAIASRLLPLEKFPGIEIPEIMVQTPYPNSTPAEVERLITRPLEEGLATISGIREIRSSSTENGSNISIQFDWDAAINAKSIEAREKIDSVRHLLPDDLERVHVFQFNTNDLPIFQLRISSNRDLRYAYDLLDRSLRKPIERVAGVSSAILYGVQKPQIMIRLQHEKLISHGLNSDTIVALLRASNFAKSAGYVRTERDKIRVNPVGEFRSLNDIRQLPIGSQLRLADIAEVSMESPRAIEGRHLDQTFAIGMNVFKESNANLVDVSQRVMAVIDEVRNDPQFNGINLYVMDDLANGVTTSLSDLLNAGLLGALLSFVVLYAFLRNITTTLIVVTSVPIAIFITLGMMYLLGYSLNILSLMGLMLAVGMLVDNAVVVTESIQYERDQGYDGEQATQRGISKVAMAVIAGTLTTAIVFLPNIVGEKIDVTIFLEHVAVAICISLLASLILSQTLIPLLATRLLKQRQTNTQQAPAQHRWYRRSLAWTQRHRKVTTLLGLLLFGSIVIPLQFVSGDQDNGAFNNRLFIDYRLQGQYRLADVEAEVTRMEQYLYAHQQDFGIDSVYSYYNSTEATSTVILVEPMREPVAQLMERIREGFPALSRSKPQFGFNGGSNGNVQVTLSGPSTDVLQQLSSTVEAMLAGIDGLTDVRSEMASAQKELQIHINRQQVHRLGLSSATVAAQVGTALRGQRLRSYRADANGEIDIYVALDKDFESSLRRLQGLVIDQQQQVITLATVANFVVAPRLGEIRRLDRQTSISIGANRGDMPLADARQAITEVLSQLQLPSGYRWSLDGAFKRQHEAENVMQVNMLLALCMIYIVMAALFESVLLPTAVLSSLMLSATGVFWALMLSGESMSIMAMIGILILMGIVVNNGIVLVDRINQLQQEGMTLHEAVIEGCASRLRPILMTVATTILGLLPLAFGSTQMGGDGPPYAPMAISIIGGLLFSTITSLYLVPHSYVRLIAWRDGWRQLQQRSRRQVSRILHAADQGNSM
ncbi:efflux RND transporter permease subunit [Idiomarina xiamenensis]|uniref:Acriflavin resistance protein n=1 Tax=Idiomarina xiamenensis 10-D-4 TaxID=740709 RepID=K2K5S7_9GAMM|nr:efflux RND transporter permease subunit [Idiomarina xiamenensis]EKE82968.1 acriflavin resistance protein [Idiomarina xiamenensis 10-D-4]